MHVHTCVQLMVAVAATPVDVSSITDNGGIMADTCMFVQGMYVYPRN